MRAIEGYQEANSGASRDAAALSDDETAELLALCASAPAELALN